MTNINTPEAILEETASILNFDEHKGDHVLYSVKDPEMPERVRVAAIDTQTWLDLGKPETVTQSIRPGDALNDARARAYARHSDRPLGLRLFTAFFVGVIGMVAGVVLLGMAAAVGTGVLLALQFMLDLLQGV